MQKTNKLKTTNLIIRALISRILCLVHIGLSIYVLFSVKKDFKYLLPIIGAILILAEASVVLVVFKGKEPFQWFSPLFFIYVSTIVGCYWFLELENVNKSLQTGYKRRDRVYITPEDLLGDITGIIKIIWSQLEIQIFFGLIVVTRWMVPRNQALSPISFSDLLLRYFCIICDMLDFLTILHDETLIANRILVYFTLSAWSWSTCQFFIFTPNLDDEHFTNFTRFITNSLFSVLFLDLPYFGVRVAAIFAFGSHNYNSYFFMTKNLIMILLQLHTINSTFSERNKRETKIAKQLRNQPGFDKEGHKLFDPNEIAKKNYIAQRLRNLENSDNATASLDFDLDESPSNQRMPRTIETVVHSKRQNADVYGSTNENLRDQSPKSFKDDTPQVRKPEPRTNFKQNVHQYGLKLENDSHNTSFDSARKNPLYSTNFNAHNSSKNTIV